MLRTPLDLVADAVHQVVPGHTAAAGGTSGRVEWGANSRRTWRRALGAAGAAAGGAAAAAVAGVWHPAARVSPPAWAAQSHGGVFAATAAAAPTNTPPPPSSRVHHAPPPHEDDGAPSPSPRHQLSRHSWPEFVRGMAASATNIIATFPLNKLISRQAYEGLLAREAFHTMRVEGLAYVYRGIAPPLLQKGVSMGIMWGSYDLFFHAITYAVTGRVDDRPATGVPRGESQLWVRATAGLLSGSMEALLTPFERMQTILQHRHYTEQFANTWDVARKLAPYGASEYYRGMTAILLRNGPANAIFFLLRDPVREALTPPAGARRLSGSGSGSSSGGSSGSGGSSSGGPPRADVEHDAAPLSRTPDLPVPVLLAGALPRSQAAWSFLLDFASGAVLGASISTVLYPINMAKSVMQLQIGGSFRGIGETLVQVYHERNGITGMYRGVGINVLRSLLSWGIVNSAYEQYKLLMPLGDTPPAARLA